MRRLWSSIRRVPRWGWACAAGFTLFSTALYKLAQILSHALGTYDRAIVWKLPAIDDRIAVVPGFVLVYVYTYAFWVLGHAAVSLTKKRNFINYSVGFFSSCFIGFLLFTFMPTVMDRAGEGLLRVGDGPGFCRWLLALVYRADGGAEGFNLFPSFHCLIGLCCYLGVRGQPEIPKSYRACALVTTALICLSALYTKQHYFPDVVGGVAIPIVCFALVKWIDPGRFWDKGDGKSC